MQVNDVFKVDQAAIDELELSVQDGQEYRITQLNTVEARASRIVAGTPQKGRPRRFPIATVARLLGQPVPTSTSTSSTSPTAETQNTEEAPLVVDLGPTEDQKRNEEAVVRATSTNSQDW